VHQVLVHVATETHRHAGHADVLREAVDGAAGLLAGSSNLPEDGYDWAAHVARVAARRRGSADPAGPPRSETRQPGQQRLLRGRDAV
jgi:hypothetical protein